MVRHFQRPSEQSQLYMMTRKLPNAQHEYYLYLTGCAFYENTVLYPCPSTEASGYRAQRSCQLCDNRPSLCCIVALTGGHPSLITPTFLYMLEHIPS